MLVYKITNKINGKAYIGITRRRSPMQRWGDHRRLARFGKGALLGRAFRKYGNDAFSFEVLCECSSVRELVACERGLIAEHGTYRPHGYNLTSGGEGSGGRVVGDVERADRAERARKMHRLGLLPKRRAGEWRQPAAAIIKISAAKRENFKDPAFAARMAAILRAAIAKVTVAQVAEIKRLLAAGGRGSVLAAQFGISEATISMIRSRRRWGDVEAATSILEPSSVD